MFVLESTAEKKKKKGTDKSELPGEEEPLDDEGLGDDRDEYFNQQQDEKQRQANNKVTIPLCFVENSVHHLSFCAQESDFGKLDLDGQLEEEEDEQEDKEDEEEDDGGSVSGGVLLPALVACVCLNCCITHALVHTHARMHKHTHRW